VFTEHCSWPHGSDLKFGKPGKRPGIGLRELARRIDKSPAYVVALEMSTCLLA